MHGAAARRGGPAARSRVARGEGGGGHAVSQPDPVRREPTTCESTRTREALPPFPSPAKYRTFHHTRTTKFSYPPKSSAHFTSLACTCRARTRESVFGILSSPSHWLPQYCESIQGIQAYRVLVPTGEGKATLRSPNLNLARDATVRVPAAPAARKHLPQCPFLANRHALGSLAGDAPAARGLRGAYRHLAATQRAAHNRCEMRHRGPAGPGGARCLATSAARAARRPQPWTPGGPVSNRATRDDSANPSAARAAGGSRYGVETGRRRDGLLDAGSCEKPSRRLFRDVALPFGFGPTKSAVNLTFVSRHF